MAYGLVLSSPPRRPAAPTYRRGVEHADESCSVKSPRRRRGGDGESLVAFFNKRFDILLWASLLLLAGHGGGWKQERGVRLLMSCSYPDGEASVPSEWKNLVLLDAPWWSSTASTFFRCNSNKLGWYGVHLAAWVELVALLLAGRGGEEGKRLH